MMAILEQKYSTRFEPKTLFTFQKFIIFLFVVIYSFLAPDDGFS